MWPGEHADPAFPYVVQLRWGDFDSYGHANNVAFVDFLGAAREQFLVAVLGDVPAFVLARIELDYRHEVLVGTTHLVVAINIERIGRSSVVTRETLALPGGDVVAEALVTMVLWDEVGRRSRAATEAERRAFEAIRS